MQTTTITRLRLAPGDRLVSAGQHEVCDACGYVFGAVPGELAVISQAAWPGELPATRCMSCHNRRQRTIPLTSP